MNRISRQLLKIAEEFIRTNDMCVFQIEKSIVNNTNDKSTFIRTFNVQLRCKAIIQYIDEKYDENNFERFFKDFKEWLLSLCFDQIANYDSTAQKSTSYLFLPNMEKFSDRNHDIGFINLYYDETSLYAYHVTTKDDLIQKKLREKIDEQEERFYQEQEQKEITELNDLQQLMNKFYSTYFDFVNCTAQEQRLLSAVFGKKAPLRLETKMKNRSNLYYKISPSAYAALENFSLEISIEREPNQQQFRCTINNPSSKGERIVADKKFNTLQQLVNFVNKKMQSIDRLVQKFINQNK